MKSSDDYTFLFFLETLGWNHSQGFSSVLKNVTQLKGRQLPWPSKVGNREQGCLIMMIVIIYMVFLVWGVLENTFCQKIMLVLLCFSEFNRCDLGS